jgi:hypothetical protein
MHRNLSSCVVSTLAASLGALGACQSADDEQAELQALLDDDTLQQVPPAATAAGAVSRAEPAPLALAGPPPLSWRFDDCTPLNTLLRESSPFITTNIAFRAVNVACVDGVQGLGVAIAAPEDIVYVPDQPTFTFENGVTVAGWFKPASTNSTRTLIRKRDKGTSSFALVLNGGKFQFVVSFGSGRAASVTAPSRARADVFQHVAASYGDGVLRLYIDGAEVGSLRVAGTIPVGAGPLLVGNDGSERRFNGTIDSVAFATRALDAVEVQQLNCLSERPTMVFTPEVIPPTPVGVPVIVDIALTNHNPANCAPLTFDLQPFDGGLQLDPPAGSTVQSAPVPSGATGHMTLTATAPQSADPRDERSVTFQIREASTNFFGFGFIPFEIAPAVGCHVDVRSELMITSLSVVEDALRTRSDILPGDPRNGAWTIKRLFEDMAPTAADAPAMVEAMLTTFTAPRTINGFTVETRPGMQAEILANWPRIDGQLDLASAPLRLMAIVNRFDLRNLANGDAGEGRFVFAFTRRDGTSFEATLILEYKLPAATEQDVSAWAQSFHALGALPPGESYNAALQAITDRFVRRGARPGRPNGSAISSVRTNEIDFSDNGIWELRQFNLSPTTGLLVVEPLDLTPDRSFDNTDTLASYINANQAEIIAERHTVPAVFAGQPFQGGAVFNDLTTWFAPGVDPSARHHFALNTCNGCHSLEETNTGFLQIAPDEGEAFLSGFLTGTTVVDQVTREPRFFDDLGRRKVDLEAIVCPGPSAALGATLPNGTTLRQGIRRVH